MRKSAPANLAAFYFSPSFDWSDEEAEAIYYASESPEYNQVGWEDCIVGMSRLPSESIDLVIADPPFGIGFTGKASLYNRNAEHVVEGYREISAQEYPEFSQEWIAQVARVLKPSGSAYLISGYSFLDALYAGMRSAGLHLQNLIAWHYPFGAFTKKKFVTSHYPILFVTKQETGYFFNKIQHYVEDVWTIPRENLPGQLKNGTKLPTALVQKMIDFSSRPGDLVLDPFLGNGTTAVTAKGAWRHFLGFEQNEQMKPVIRQNIEQVEVGELYTSYISRLPSLLELAEEYPTAYKAYCEAEHLVPTLDHYF